MSVADRAARTEQLNAFTGKPFRFGHVPLAGDYPRPPENVHVVLHGDTSVATRDMQRLQARIAGSAGVSCTYYGDLVTVGIDAGVIPPARVGLLAKMANLILRTKTGRGGGETDA